MRKLFLCSIFFIFTASTLLYAQEEVVDGPQSLEMQYEQLIDKSETFQQFKVIPIVKMNAFKGALADTLAQHQSEIDEANREKNNMAIEKDTLLNRVEVLETELAETQKLVDGIQLFGMTVTKTIYNVVLWSIIIGLIALLVFAYMAFLTANRVAKQSKNDKLRVDEELEELRKTAHEKQVKVKRELQTALNKIDELSK